MHFTLENLELHVPFKIWQRGFDYYENGAVTMLEETSPGEWTAIVEGTEDYTVEISLAGNGVEAWTCDCPYDMGNICKHVVAVLLAIQAEREKVGNSAFSKMGTQTKNNTAVEKEAPQKEYATIIEEEKNRPFADFIKQAKNEELRAFVEAYAMNDETFKLSFIDYLTKKHLKPENKIQKDYCKEVKKIFAGGRRRSWSRYSYRNEFDDDVNWEKIDVAMRKIFAEANMLLKVGETEGPVDVACQFFHSLADNVDDSILYDDVALCDMGECCETAGRLIMETVKYPSVSDNRKRAIFQRVSGMPNLQMLSSYFDYDFEELEFELGKLVQTSEERLAMFDERIKEQEKVGYGISPYVQMKMDYLDELGRYEEMITLMENFLHLTEIRREKVMQMQEAGKYDEALKVLDDGIAQAREENHPELEIQWVEMKLNIYEIQKDDKKIIDTCCALFIAKNGRKEYYEKLKEYIPGNEWRTFLYNLIASLQYKGEEIADIYEIEQEYDDLQKWIMAESYGRIRNVLNYGPRMPQEYHSALLKTFILDIKNYAADKYNINRRCYDEIAQWLHEAKKLVGGKLVVKSIVEEFRVLYKRRSAMMEELHGL